MPIARCYPTAVTANYSLTNQNNILGYVSTAATHTGSLSVGTVISCDTNVDLGKIPAGSTINSIAFKVRARAGGAGTRSFYSVALRAGAGNPVKLNVSESPLTTSDAVYTITMTRDDLTGAGFTDALIIDSACIVEWTFISKSTTSTTTTWTHAWLEVDFTPPANHWVTDVTLSADTTNGDTNSWTNPANAIAEDNAYATFNKTTAGFNSFYFLSSGVDSIPAGATLKGILFEIDYKVSSTSSSPVFWLKFFSFADNVWESGVITDTNERRYIFGGYNNTMGRTRASISDAYNYLRISQSNTTSTQHQIDHIRLQIYWEQPVSGNTLFFGENF